MIVPAIETVPIASRAEPSPRPLFSAFAVLIGLALVFGFLNFLREPPHADFHAEWLALVFFSLATVALAPLLPRCYPLAWSVLAAPLALGALLLVHGALGRYGYPQQLWFWGGYLALAFLAMAVGQGIRAAGLRAEVTHRLAWALVIAASLNSFAQIVQAVRIESSFAPYVVPLVERSMCRLYGNIGQANQASTLAWIGIASVFYLHGVGRLSSRWAMPPLILMLLGSALSASRMAWVFMAVLCLLVVCLRAWPAPNRSARWLTAAMLVCGFATATVGAASVLPAIDAKCASGVERLTDAREPGNVIRKELWRQSIDVWRSSPWIGVGPMNFAATVYRSESLEMQRPLDMYVHNIPLQILAEFGIVGLGAVAAAVLSWLVLLIRLRARLEAADALLIAVVGVLAVHSLLEFPLYYTYFLVLAGLAVGMLIRTDRAAATPALRLRLPIGAVATAMLVGAAALFHEYQRLDRLYWLEFQRVAFSAAPTSEVRGVLHDAAADIRLFEMYRDHVLGLSDPITKADLRRKIEDTDRLLGYAPQAITIARRVLLAVLDDDADGARWHLQRLFGFFPRQAEEMAETFRRFIKDRPEEFKAFEPILAEELARRPVARW